MGAEKNVRPIAKKPVIIGASIAAVAVIAVVAAILLNLNRITAISIRIQRLVGTVNLYDEKGKEKSMIEKMRLNSGHSLKTAVESLVMVSLDESRLLTLEEASQAKIKAKGKQLEFNLTSGSLFFNVNEKLEDDETFDIRTSTMVCGIRGTSAFIGKDSKGHETVMVTDGTVHVVAENPRTHEITEVDVNAGEMITIYLDEEAEGDATISIKKENFREEDLPALALDAIRKDTALTDRISRATGFSKDKLYMLHKASSSEGISMFGEAAAELSSAGIDDAIPFLGNKARIMVVAANSAADVAGPNLPLEESILLGAKGTVKAGSEAGFNDEELSKVTESTVSNTARVVTEAKAAGLNDEDLVKVADTVTGTINETVSMMGSGNYDVVHVNEAVEAIGTVMTETVNEATGSAQDVLAAVSSEADRVNSVVETDVNRQATGEATVASILGLEGGAEPQVTVSDPGSEQQSSETTKTETSDNTKNEKQTQAGNTVSDNTTADNTQGSEASSSSNESSAVAVTGVSLDKSSFKMDAGETVTLTATITPANATNTAVTWTSSDDSVATVAGNGLTATVTGVADGTATITATTADGAKVASFTVTVQAGLTKYAITINAGANGTVTSSVAESADGNPVTLTVTPNEHYYLDAVYANGVNSSVALTQSGNSYTFTMPAEAVTVNATFLGETYTLTLNTEGGSFAAAALPTEYVYGTGVTLPTSGT